MNARIADISYHQGSIIWSEARKKLSFVIFRASIGLEKDIRYLNYTKNCGLPFGVYHYVKAGTAQDARQEARWFVECAHRARARPTIYFADIEFSAQTKTTTEAVCVAFLEELRALGCPRVGLYIGQSRYKYAGKAIAMCDAIWIPRYGENDGSVPPEKYYPKYPCALWQYTSHGHIDGITGRVDLNLLWGDKALEWFTGTDNTAQISEKEGSMPMFTNLMLAAYCEQVYAAKWVYWYGTCGYDCTTSLYNRKKEQYPGHYTSSRESGYKADIRAGKMCADCVGMIKSFFWKGGKLDGKNVYQSNNCPDKSANGMYELCKEHGKIATIPEIPGLVVWKSGHIGVYIGNGYTIEERGFAYDCVKRKVSEGPWTHWGKLPESMLIYVDGIASAEEHIFALGERTLQNGCTGADVKEMQEALLKLDYPLPKYGADGDYGTETQTAVSAFQADNGLEATGIFDTAAYKALIDVQNVGREEPDTPDGGGAPAYVLIIEGDKHRLELVQSAYGGTLAAVDSVIAVAPMLAAGVTSPGESSGFQPGAAADPLRVGGGA